MPIDLHTAAAACRELAVLLERAAIDFESPANHDLNHPDAITSTLDALGASLLHTARLLANGNPVANPAAGPPATRPGSGPLQQYVLRLPGLASADGMTSAEIANAVGRRMPNIHTMMGLLHKYGLIDVIAGRPRRWRLAPDVACTPALVVDILNLVGPDEWTTIGDISLALFGDLSAAPTIAYTLAQHPEAMARRARVRPDATEAVLPDGASSPETADRHRQVSWDDLQRRRLAQAHREPR